MFGCLKFITSAPTSFPPEYVQEFQYCFDRAPSVLFQEIQAILHEELGRSIDTVFEYVDPTPIASASVAQVAIVRDIRESMLEQVDFIKEAANVEAFRTYLEAMGLTRQDTAPKVYQQYSSKRVFTMGRLYGVPLTDLNSINSLVPRSEASLITALNVWFGGLLACESFHADVHADMEWRYFPLSLSSPEGKGLPVGWESRCLFILLQPIQIPNQLVSFFKKAISLRISVFV
ncbi:putative aarF domain-containing protein kinase [Abeliophyllum distichum]|uniref:AarF domain-containing protein kinase n=1 Tax=Abeliophyllum distichum TaxID=126358 RepID=A0ABD1VWS5_9LAMI